MMSILEVGSPYQTNAALEKTKGGVTSTPPRVVYLWN
jgi:hypothetical protein